MRKRQNGERDGVEGEAAGESICGEIPGGAARGIEMQGWRHGVGTLVVDQERRSTSKKGSEERVTGRPI